MATKAAKSITINATKYELANALAVNDGKVQLKAKDVVLDEANLPDGGKYIAITLVRDAGSDVGNSRRAYLISSIETSDNIDPTTYTGQDMANDFLAGGLKIVAFVPSNGWSDNSYIEISELNVFDNTEGQTPNFYYTFLGAGLSTAVGNDTIKYKLSVDGISTADTLDTLENGYHHAYLYNCLDTWEAPVYNKYVIFDFGYEATGFESCEDQNGNTITNASQVLSIINQGGAVYFKYNGQGNNYLERFNKSRQWTNSSGVNIELTVPVNSTNIRKLTLSGAFSVNTPTATITNW